jgi:hypothetical protein
LRLLKDIAAITPVVATIILCGVVLTVGISIWSFTYSVTRSLENDYYERIKRQIDAISERFMIEHVSYDNESDVLNVWVFNYGKIDVQVDVYARGDAEGQNASGILIPEGEIERISVPLVANVSYELSITVISRRQNTVYAIYVVGSS